MLNLLSVYRHILKFLLSVRNRWLFSLLNFRGIDNYSLPLWNGSKMELEKILKKSLMSVIEFERSGRNRLLFYWYKSIHSSKVERIELFTRSFIGCGYFLTYSEDKSSVEYKLIASYFRRQLLEGCSRDSQKYFGYHTHLHIENTSLIIGLLQTKEVIWLTYNDSEKASILSYFEQYVGTNPYQNNWILFRIFLLSFISSETGEDYFQELHECFEIIKNMHYGSGWFKDGIDGDANIDYYNFWGFHYYLRIYRIYFSELYSVEHLIDLSVDFTNDYVHFFTDKGSHPIFGRSQIYRFATLAPLAYFVNDGCYGEEDLPGLRAKAIGEVNSFLRHCLNRYGLWNMGLFRLNMDYIEPYSGGASVYWFMKAFSLLAIDGSSEFWNDDLKGIRQISGTNVVAHNSFIIHKLINHRIVLFNLFNKSGKYPTKYNHIVYRNVTLLDTEYVSSLEGSIVLFKAGVLYEDWRIQNWILENKKLSVVIDFPRCNSGSIRLNYILNEESIELQVFIESFGLKSKVRIFGFRNSSCPGSLEYRGDSKEEIRYRCINDIPLLEIMANSPISFNTRLI